MKRISSDLEGVSYFEFSERLQQPSECLTGQIRWSLIKSMLGLLD
jgi:hypothetical protein